MMLGLTMTSQLATKGTTRAAIFITFLLALTHGIMSGTGTRILSMQGLYWVSGGLFIFLTIFRILYALLRNDQLISPQKVN